MIRHAHAKTEAISFFSFLSVISCTIGPLMLVLVCITVLSFWGADIEVDPPDVKGGAFDPNRIYVECRKDGLIVHPEETVVTLDDLDDPECWIRGPFGRCLSKLISQGQSGSVHFLVRRDGLPAYRKAFRYALAVGGGTEDEVAEGRASFSMGRQLLLMTGPLRVKRADEVREPRLVSGRGRETQQKDHFAPELAAGPQQTSEPREAQP